LTVALAFMMLAHWLLWRVDVDGEVITTRRMLVRKRQINFADIEHIVMHPGYVRIYVLGKRISPAFIFMTRDFMKLERWMRSRGIRFVTKEEHRQARKRQDVLV